MPFRCRLAAVALAAIILTGCSHTPAQRSGRYLNEGKEYLQKRDFARAILAFKNAVKQAPNDAEPYYQLGLVSLAMSDFRAAAAAFQKATELNPQHAGAQTKLAELMTTARSKEVLEDAQKRLQEVLKATPNNLEALDTLAVAEMRLGQRNLAEQHLQEAVEKFPKDLTTAVGLASFKLRQGDAKGGEEVLKKAVALSPQSAEAKILLARYYQKIKRSQDAEAQYRAVIADDPANGLAMLGLGLLEEELGHPEQAEETLKRAAAIPDRRFRPIHAWYLYQKGKKEAALAEFEAVAAQNPDDRDARTRLIAAYMMENRSGDAERVATKALKDNPKDTDALQQRSELYLESNRVQQAQNDLAVLLRQRPDSGYVHYLLARAHEAQSSALQANQELGEAVRLQPDLLVARLSWASSLAAGGNAATALKLLDQAPSSQRRLPAVLAQRNAVLWAMGNKGEVRKGVDAGLAVERTPELLLQDARLKLSQGSYAAAEAPLQEALRMAPEDLRIIESLADSYAAQKQNAKALDLVRRTAAARPNSIGAQRLLGGWLLKQGDKAGARTALQTAKALEPVFGDTDLTLAEIDIADGKLDAARDRLTQGIASSQSRPETKSTGLSAEVLLGNLELRAGHPDKAIEHYRKVVRQNPENTLVMNNLAFLLADYANQADEALQLAQKVKQMDPDNPDVADTLGWAYYHKGIYRSAVEQLTAAAAKGSPQTKYHLAMAYLRAGDHQRGRQVLDEAMRLNPNLPEARMAVEVLSQSAGVRR